MNRKFVPRRLSSDDGSPFVIDGNTNSGEATETTIAADRKTSSLPFIPGRQRIKKTFILKACLVVIIAIVFINGTMDTQQAVRRSLACKRRNLKRMKNDMNRIRSRNDEEHNYRHDGTNNFMDRSLVVDDGGDLEDCDTAFPEQVAPEVIGTEEYYAPPEEDSGVYYAADAIVPIAEINNNEVDTENIDPIILVPDIEEPTYYDTVDTTVLDTYEPVTYEPVETTTRPTDTVAYSVVITACPDTYSPPESEVTDPGSEIFEASAMIKNDVCNSTESTTAASARRRELVSQSTTRPKITKIAPEQSSSYPLDEQQKYYASRRIVEDVTDEGNYTMYALVHPEAVNCPNPDGTTYNRVKLLQDQGYHVEIVGQPITNIDLEESQPYIEEHIEEDVGVRDSMALHAFNLEEHKAVVLLDYSTQLQDSIQEEIDDLVHDPNKKVKCVRDKDGGVSKAFMILKPSKQNFEYYRNQYLTTPYYPETGWNGQGHNQCKGKLGLKGFFSYVASTDSSWEELDRCTYNNQLDDKCVRQRDVDQCKVVRHSKTVCGDPRDCPYDHPLWSYEKKMACQQAHANYFKARIEFEEKHFIKNKKQQRIGRFKYNSFMGYCKGPGKRNYLGMTDKIHLKPEWQVLCDNAGVCPPGSYMKNDCTCTDPNEDACNACPPNTMCQRTPELRCIDCSCGFCDSAGVSCCEFNGVNNCRAGPGDNKDCVMQKNFFPAFSGQGNVCSGVEISETATPNGCGCKPNDSLPCTYNPELQGVYEDHCNICTTADIVEGKCSPICVDCLARCDGCLYNAISSVDAAKKCLKTMDDDCRANCASFCKK